MASTETLILKSEFYYNNTINSFLRRYFKEYELWDALTIIFGWWPQPSNEFKGIRGEARKGEV